MFEYPVPGPFLIFNELAVAVTLPVLLNDHCAYNVTVPLVAKFVTDCLFEYDVLVPDEFLSSF